MRTAPLKLSLLAALLAAAPAQAELIAFPRGSALKNARAAVASHPSDTCTPVRAARRKDKTTRFVCADGRAYVAFRCRGYDPAIIQCRNAKMAGLSCRE